MTLNVSHMMSERLYYKICFRFANQTVLKLQNDISSHTKPLFNDVLKSISQDV